MSAPWLNIIGIGEDGVEGLSSAAQTLVRNAHYVIGGARHLSLAKELVRGEAHQWPVPFSKGIEQVLEWRGSPVAVLASGDPFCFGAGSALAKHIRPDEMICIPLPSSISLACSRLGWGWQDVRVVSLCGRPLETLAPVLQPDTRLIVLSADATTPALVAEYLCGYGFGASRLHVLESLDGVDEEIRAFHADEALPEFKALNLLCIELQASLNARIIPLCSGLDDDLFEHDGQLTKREIRAVTLSSLSPTVGQMLWDVGAGAGSIAIEWMLRHPSNRAIAVERDPERAARIARNALSLGVPGLKIVVGRAPQVLEALEQPDAIFIGGGLSDVEIFDRAWSALPAGGRLVANAVTLEGEAVMMSRFERYNANLTRIGVERLDNVGRLHAFRPAMRVMQLVARKGAEA